MSEHSDYWADFSRPLRNRHDAAIDKLEAIGFEFDEDYKFRWKTAAANFNKATLWKVYALGQILEREQPVTVRGTMYRVIGIAVPDSSTKKELT